MRSGRVIAELSSSALLRNYRNIQERAPNQLLLPMLKANAYGHGVAWAAGVLRHEGSLAGFGVATLEEGAELREALRSSSDIPIVVFSGAAPWTEEKGRFCEQFGLTPMILTERDFELFVRQGWPARLRYELKFNTGMNRLGLALDSVSNVIRFLRSRPVTWAPSGFCSHLASAESPAGQLSRGQLRAFRELRRQLSSRWPASRFHLANSAGIWNRESWALDELTSVVRPGLALYGAPPWEGAEARGLEAVLRLRAEVVLIRELESAERVGYGGVFRASRRLRTAIFSAGYADGIPRALSQRHQASRVSGEVWAAGRRERILGRVSMDLCAISCGPKLRVGDWVELLGPRIDPWKQARIAGTLPYELYTGISPRVPRKEVP